MTNHSPHPSKRRSPPVGGLSLAGVAATPASPPTSDEVPITRSEPDPAPAYGGGVRSPEAEPAPREFVAVVDALLAAGQSRTDVLFREVGRPTRLAPHGIALAASLERGETELAAGRLVVLHDPAGQPAWNGVFRIACYARAPLDPEMIADPMLAEVTWSWLEESLSERGAELTNLAGTVTTTASSRFGQIAEEDDTCEVELRCSWSPTWSPEDAAGVRAHLDAMCDLLTLMAGEPPPGDGVVSLSSRAH